MKIVISFLLVIGTIECWSQSFSKEFLAKHPLDTLFVNQIPKGRGLASMSYFVRTTFQDSLRNKVILMIPKTRLMNFIKLKFNLPEDSLDYFIRQSILEKKVYQMKDTVYFDPSLTSSYKVDLRKLKKLERKKLSFVLSKYFNISGHIRHGFKAKEGELAPFLFNHYIIFEYDIGEPHISAYYREALQLR